MRRVLLTITILLLMAGCAWAQLSGVAPGMAFTEEDGSPDTTCFVAKFTNGSLTDNGDGTCSVSTSGGGGGTPGGSNTEIQYNNSSSTTMYVGIDSSVTTSNGFPIYPRQNRSKVDILTTYKGPIYGIVASGTVDTRYWETTQDA